MFSGISKWRELCSAKYLFWASASAAFFSVIFLGAMVGEAKAAPPLEAYGKLINMRSPKLSPGGGHLASIQNYQGSEILAIYSLTGGKASIIRLSGAPDSYEEISSYFWVNDDRLAIFLRGPVLVGPKHNRMISRTSRMIAVNRDGSKFIKLPSGSRGASRYRVIIDALPDDDDHVLVTGDNSSYETNVYKLNVNTGKATQVVRGRVSVWDYRTNFDHEIVIRYHWNNNTKDWEPYRRRPDSLNWSPIFSSADVKDLHFITFTMDPDVFIISKEDKAGWDHIYSYSVPRKKILKEIRSFEGRMFGGMLVDKFKNKVIGYTEAKDYWKQVYSDPEMAQLQSRMQAAIPGQRISLGSRTRSGALRIIIAQSPSDPISYYLYERAKGSLSLIGHQYPDLEKLPHYEVRKIQYKARDDLAITAYLTLPHTPGPHKTIVMPHGGPTSRSYMNFDYWAQFLASRGYAVLEPNFRGSTGYGKAFREAGYGEWGLKMQDDVTDGTRHLIAQGITDPSRICIMGWSYGGYAALMGVVKEPSLYKCAIAGGAVTDIPALMKDEHRYKNRSSRAKSIGHMKTDRKKLKQNSPINRVEEIQVPVLIFQGEFDSVVDVRQGREMAKALKPTGKLYKYIELENGDHYLSLQKNRMLFLKEIEGFLAKTL
jgi:dipeptidyl aminopeptidase/acylaminoacyl peptidase